MAPDNVRGIKNKESGKWKKVAAFVALFLIFGVLMNSAHKVYNKKIEAQKALARMEKEVEDLKNRQKFLENSLQRLTTREGMEFEIRKKLNVAEAGESVAIIVDEELPNSASGTESSPWQKFKDFFTEWLR